MLSTNMPKIDDLASAHPPLFRDYLQIFNGHLLGTLRYTQLVKEDNKELELRLEILSNMLMPHNAQCFLAFNFSA